MYLIYLSALQMKKTSLHLHPSLWKVLNYVSAIFMPLSCVISWSPHAVKSCKNMFAVDKFSKCDWRYILVLGDAMKPRLNITNDSSIETSEKDRFHLREMTVWKLILHNSTVQLANKYSYGEKSCIVCVVLFPLSSEKHYMLKLKH